MRAFLTVSARRGIARPAEAAGALDSLETEARAGEAVTLEDALLRVIGGADGRCNEARGSGPRGT